MLREPWSEPEIKKHVTEKYNVQFDMFSKINVNGSDAHHLFVFLKSKLKGTLFE
ncbi:unnamed protein product [Echinostoma caproni]|uniref:Uncharacterized protein n=1 Tax=Echinostoma caproni TaxID=27848 RepID=A0A183ANG4_9TREM|nr:unnamed protein product [Echinostoma caproni]